MASRAECLGVSEASFQAGDGWRKAEAAHLLSHTGSQRAAQLCMASQAWVLW